MNTYLISWQRWSVLPLDTVEYDRLLCPSSSRALISWRPWLHTIPAWVYVVYVYARHTWMLMYAIRKECHFFRVCCAERKRPLRHWGLKKKQGDRWRLHLDEMRTRSRCGYPEEEVEFSVRRAVTFCWCVIHFPPLLKIFCYYFTVTRFTIRHKYTQY